MPYSITTKDGITVNNIPDEVAPDASELKDRVAKARASGGTSAPKVDASKDAFAQKIRAEGGLSGDENFFDNLHTGIGKAMSDTALGAQQFANWASRGIIGNKEALAAEAKDREERDKALMRTGGGMIGKYGTDIATSFLPMGAAAKVIKGAGMLPTMARAGVSGAAGNLFNPDEDYSGLKQAGLGAAFGVGGDVVGRGAARLWAPFRNKGASATAQESADVLNRAGLPNQLPSTQTGDATVQGLSNALEQIPGAGHWIKKARGENLAWGTGKYVDESTGGSAVTDLTKAARDRLEANANRAINEFKAGPDVPTHDMPARLQELAAQLAGTPTIASKAALTGKVGALERELTPVLKIPPKQPGIFNAVEEVAGSKPGPGILNTVERVAGEQGPRSYPGVQAVEEATGGGLSWARQHAPLTPTTPMPPTKIERLVASDKGGFEKVLSLAERSPKIVNTTRSAREMIDLRNEAAEMARNGSTHLERKAGKELQDYIEQAIKRTHGDEGTAFDAALRQYGGTKDVLRGAGEFGEHLVGGHLPTERMVAGARGHSDMFPQRDRLTAAMASNMPTPPKGWPRSLLTGILLGGTSGGAALGGYATDKLLNNPTPGALAAPVLATSLIAGLSRKAPSQAQIDAIIKLLTATGQGVGKQF